MKAAILIESMDRPGGTELVARNLREALTSAGTDCTILTVNPYSGDLKGVEWIGEGSVTHRIDEAMHRLGAQMLINFTYELNAHLPVSGGYKNIGVLHWSIAGYERAINDIIESKPLPARLLSAIKMRRTYSRLHKAMAKLDSIVALTEAGRRELLEICPEVDPGNVYVIPNHLPPQPESKGKHEQPRMVFAGRLSPEKGVVRLLDIWAFVTKAAPDLRLDIYGQGPERAAMERYIADNQIHGIRFRGFESDLSKVYDGALAMLSTSDTEGFGMTFIEAMHYGAVPMTFDVPISPKEVIGEAGVVVPAFDTQAYAAAVVRLYRDEEYRRGLVAEGMKRVNDFSPSVVIKAWQTMMQDIM